MAAKPAVQFFGGVCGNKLSWTVVWAYADVVTNTFFGSIGFHFLYLVALLLICLHVRQKKASCKG